MSITNIYITDQSGNWKFTLTTEQSQSEYEHAYFFTVQKNYIIPDFLSMQVEITFEKNKNSPQTVAKEEK